MKNLFLFLVTLFFLNSCNKEIIENKNNRKSLSNNELSGIYSVLSDYDFDVFVNYNVSNDPNIMGTVQNSPVSVNFLNQSFNFGQGEFKKMVVNSLKAESGKVIDVDISSSQSQENFELYVPKMLKIDQDFFTLGKINKNNAVITWNKDENNELGVLVSINVYDYSFGGSGNTLRTENFVIDDTGELDITEFLNNQSAKSVDISILRGNAVKHMVGDKKMVLCFITNQSFPMIDIE